MRLQRLARVAIDADDLAVRVTGKIDADFDFNFAQFLRDLLLLDLLWLVQDGSERAGYTSDFVEEGELALIEFMVFF